MAKTNTNISHNPSSNAKLGNGIARVPEYLKAGINVGLGHDSATCNNSLDIFETMKWAALIHRASRTDASLMPTDTVLRMATVNAGKALHQNTGILRPGMKADIILINLSSQHFVPLMTGKDSNLKAHLVYSAHGEDVHTTIIDGKIVMQNRMLTNVDEKEVIEKANHAFSNVLEKIRK
jgi:5-methylthioadenosine/S-adenosylhomocysteine deaminase